MQIGVRVKCVSTNDKNERTQKGSRYIKISIEQLKIVLLSFFFLFFVNFFRDDSTTNPSTTYIYLAKVLTPSS